ncbi:MAG: GIY-YIG nuclease family protein [Alphaproteobacteria bacterium]|nr:GIY-YIG nuclease family protein [Alphaproteobacteria bacterium]
MEKSYWVYIVTDKPFGTIYVGVTNDIVRRADEHRRGLVKGFTRKYGLKKLVYCEEYATAMEAIEREHQIKHWNREWKIHRIKQQNPTWRDLYETIL